MASNRHYVSGDPNAENIIKHHKKHHRSKEEKRRAEIAKAFREYDRDGDGVITYREAHAVLSSQLGYSADKTKRLFRACDRNGDGKLSSDEFCDFFFKVKENVRELRAMFLDFDTDGNGVISIDEAKISFRNLAFHEAEIENLVRSFDTNFDGELQYEEFVKMWNAT